MWAHVFVRARARSLGEIGQKFETRPGSNAWNFFPPGLTRVNSDGSLVLTGSFVHRPISRAELFRRRQILCLR